MLFLKALLVLHISSQDDHQEERGLSRIQDKIQIKMDSICCNCSVYMSLCVCAVFVGLKHLNIRGEQVNLNIHSVDTNIDIGIRPILV